MKLVYFNGRGFAETSRIILAVAKVDYEDYRYPIEIIDWKSHDIIKKEFDEDKANKKMLKSLNKVPYLELDGTIICQSKSIERFLAKKFGLMGSTDIEEAHIDSICETIRDIKDEYKHFKKTREKDIDYLGSSQISIKDWFKDTLCSKLSLLENILEENGYSVGDKLSLADIIIFTFITQFFDDKEESLKASQSCSKINNIINNVSGIVEIQSWIEKRPQTAF